MLFRSHENRKKSAAGPHFVPLERVSDRQTNKFERSTTDLFSSSRVARRKPHFPMATGKQCSCRKDKRRIQQADGKTAEPVEPVARSEASWPSPTAGDKSLRPQRRQPTIRVRGRAVTRSYTEPNLTPTCGVPQSHSGGRRALKTTRSRTARRTAGRVAEQQSGPAAERKPIQLRLDWLAAGDRGRAMDEQLLGEVLTDQAITLFAGQLVGQSG